VSLPQAAEAEAASVLTGNRAGFGMIQRTFEGSLSDKAQSVAFSLAKSAGLMQGRYELLDKKGNFFAVALYTPGNAEKNLPASLVYAKDDKLFGRLEEVSDYTEATIRTDDITQKVASLLTGNLAGFTMVENSIEGSSTRSLFYVKLTSDLVLSWSETVPEAKKVELVANAELYHTAYAEEGVLHLKANAIFDINRGETNQFIFDHACNHLFEPVCV